MTKRLILILFTLLFTGNVFATDCCDLRAYNKDGSVVTGVVAPVYDPGEGEYPLPINLGFLGTTDFTLNLSDGTDYSDPLVAVSALDGWSTTEKWIMSFASEPHALDPSTIVAGQSVRMFEVSTVFGTIVMVSGVVRELTPNLEYVVYGLDNNAIIFPTKPLKEMTTYMVVVTNDIKDMQGNDATPSDRYYATKGPDPWVDEEGHSTYSLIDDASAASLEGLRQIHYAQETAATSVGIAREDIILSWTAQTQAITPVLKNIRSIAKPAPTTVIGSGLSTAVIGGAGAADIYVGIITLPYYLGVPSDEDPDAALTDFWTAAPGAYVGPFDSLGLDPTSTHVTVANPFPVVTSMQTVPLLMTVPNANSGHTKPAAGWPVVIFGHGLGNDRSYMLAVADTAAAAGYAVIAIDAPLHGISPDDESLIGMLHVSNMPWADIANERTFDMDIDEDGIVDDTGLHWVNLSSMLTFRDNSRQGIADLSVLAVTIPSISYDGDALPDLDGSTIQYASQSGGSILGVAFAAIEPMVKNAFLAVPMGGVARGLEASQYFGPAIKAGLADKGVYPGTEDYETFFLALQTVLDGMDPINWGAEAALYNNIVLYEVLDDFLLPNSVPFAPLSGTEPLISAMGLTPYSSTQQSASGLDLVGRFPKPAHHWSFLSPTNPVTGTDTTNIFMEMQRQFASFIASKGTAVVVTDASVMVPEVAMAEITPPVSDLREGSKSKKAKGTPPTNMLEAIRGLSSMVRPVIGSESGPEPGSRPGLGDGDQLQKPSRVE